MNYRVYPLDLVAVVVISLLLLIQQPCSNVVDANEQIQPIKVFLLAGQSNMVGMGSIDHLDLLIQSSNKTTNKYLNTLWNNTKYNIWNDIYIKFRSNSGRLTIRRTAGYADTNRFGPEVLFGTTIGDSIRSNNKNNNSTKQPLILLIKAAYGGLDLAIDFRPPSAGIGNYTGIESNYYGWGYRMMIGDIVNALNTISSYIPNYNITLGYEILGFVWFQGWNDVLNWNKVNEYESNLAHLIRDIRIDLNQYDLPFGTILLFCSLCIHLLFSRYGFISLTMTNQSYRRAWHAWY
jgi:Carbohydrate esterase, sialic acid-specific acetylesterase